MMAAESEGATVKSAEEPGFLDRNPLVKTLLTATGVGSAFASVPLLAHEVLDMLEDRKKAKRRAHPQVSKDTIVVTLPATEKGASARDALVDFAKIHKKRRSENGSEPCVRQARNQDGTFARGYDVEVVKDAEDKGFLDMSADKAMKVFTGVSGIGLGFILTQKVYDFLKQKRLKREVAAAQKEYIDELYKDAAGRDPVAVYTPTTVGGIVSGNSDRMAESGSDALGLTGGLALLLAAASSIITKKFLDYKFKGPDDSVADNPRVQNIVVKTASGDRIAMDPVDMLAYVKMASIAMSIPGLDALPVEKDATASSTAPDYDQVVGGLFSSLGMPGDGKNQSNWNVRDMPMQDADDPTASRLQNWAYLVDPKYSDGIRAAFVSDKWTPHRVALAKHTIGKYTDAFNNSGFGKTWFGQVLSPILGYLGGGIGNLLANTNWGSRLMFDKMHGAADAAAKSITGTASALLRRRS